MGDAAYLYFGDNESIENQSKAMKFKCNSSPNDDPFRRIGQLFKTNKHNGLIIWTFWVGSVFPLDFHATKSDAYSGLRWSHQQNVEQSFCDFHSMVKCWELLKKSDFTEVETLKSQEKITELITEIQSVRENERVYFFKNRVGVTMNG